MNRLYVPEEMEQDFVKEAVRVNHTVMTVLGIFAIVMEGFSMIRILAFSGSGLQTVNSRICFGFSFFLFAAACLYLIADRQKKADPVWRYRLTLIAGSVFLLWHTLFSLYDLERSFSLGKILGATSLVAFAALGVMKPLYAAVNLLLNFALLIPYLFVVTGYDSGVLLNYSLTAAICFIIYHARFQNIRTQLLQKEEIEDISGQLEESRRQFRLSSRQYELMLRQSNLVTFEWNMENGEARFSREWTNVFGKESLIPDAEEFIRKGHTLKAQTKREILLCMENLRNGTPYQKKELLLPVADGSERWFELHLVLQNSWEDMPKCGIGILIDIMDQRQRISELEKALQRDSFTGLLNKTAIEKYGTRKLRELRDGERLYMLILDMDNFKHINDSYGHICGDYVLSRVAELMRDLAPEGSRVGRLGGDEFGAVLATERNEEAFLQYAQNLLDSIRQISWKGVDICAGGSVGIAVSRQDSSWMMLYGEADRALYRAKRSGKNRIYLIMGRHDEQTRNG